MRTNLSGHLDSSALIKEHRSDMSDTIASLETLKEDSQKWEGTQAKSKVPTFGDQAARSSKQICSEPGSGNLESGVMKKPSTQYINGSKQPPDQMRAGGADFIGTLRKGFSFDDTEIRRNDISQDNSIDNQESPRLKRERDADTLKPFKAFEKFLRQQDLPDNYETSVLYQVYNDLLLIRKWTHIRIARSRSRNYIAGMAPAAFDSVFPGRGIEEGLDRTQVIVPVPASVEFSPQQLENLCGECVHPETGDRLRCITIAIVDDDSTTAYYRIFDKWKELVDPQWKMMKKRKEEEGQGTEERTGKETKEDADSEDSDVDSECE